jgi:hypothetical protein
MADRARTTAPVTLLGQTALYNTFSSSLVKYSVASLEVGVLIMKIQAVLVLALVIAWTSADFESTIKKSFSKLIGEQIQKDEPFVSFLRWHKQKGLWYVGAVRNVCSVTPA